MTEKQQRDAFADALGPDAPAGLEAYLRGIGSGKAGECDRCAYLERQNAILRAHRGAHLERIRTLEAECASLAGRLVDVTRGDGRKDDRASGFVNAPRTVQDGFVWVEDEDGEVWVQSTDPAFIQPIHGIIRCRFPGCSEPAWRLDHSYPYLQGMTTCQAHSTPEATERTIAAMDSTPRLCNTDAARVEAERLDAGDPIVCPKCGHAGRPGTTHICPPRFVRLPDPRDRPATMGDVHDALRAGGIIADPDDPLSKHLTLKREYLTSEIAAMEAAGREP